MKTILTLFLTCLLLSNIYAQKPVADFEFEAKTFGCNGVTLKAINKSINTDSCFWDLYSSKSYSYNSKDIILLGNYSVDDKKFPLAISLIAKRNGISDTITKYYNFEDAAIRFDYLKIDTSSNDSVTVSFTGILPKFNGLPANCRWDFGDSTTSNDLTPIHKYHKSGTRLVTISLKNEAEGCSFVFQKYIHLKKDSTHPHIPFPTKNAMWTEMYYNPWPDESAKFHCFALKNSDTIINGNLYHKLYHSEDTIFTEDKLCGGIREESGVVYYYSINTLPYNLMEMQNNTEVKLFNSNFELGDTLKLQDKYLVDFDMVIEDTYDLSLNSSVRKCYQLSFSFYTWIEGIGTKMGLLFGFGLIPNNGLWNDLICFKQNDTIVYHNNQYASCYYTNTIIKDTKVQNQIIIKPNPVADNAEITFAPVYKKLEIISPLGQVVKNLNITGATSVRLNNNEIPPGIYIVLLSDKQGNKTTTKLVIE